MKAISKLMVMAVGCMMAGELSGKAFSLDLRPVSEKAESRAQVNAKSASAASESPDCIRRTTLDAGRADVGAVSVGDELSFTLFNDVEVKLVLKKKMPAPLGGDAFIAEVAGCDGVKSAVVLRTADGLTVDVQDCGNNKFYKVISTSTNVRVEEIEPKAGKCGCGVRPPPASPTSPMARKSANAVKSAKADEEVCVDVLVAYDKDARRWAEDNGGGITNFAQMAVQRMNVVLVNNDLDTLFRFRLLGIVCVDVSTNDLDGAVDSATFGTGRWAPIKDMRDKVGADVVAVLVDTGTDADITGLAWSMMPDNYAKFSEYAYSACSIRSVSWSHTMTHEVGHNLGAGHSELQKIDPGPQLYSYSAGYFFWADGVKYHTVMSYGDAESEGNLAPYFSSPRHVYKGGTVGDESHDNVLTISNTFAIAANWREAKGGEITDGFDDVPVLWITSRTKAFAKARDEGKLVFMLYGSDTCGFSTALMEGTCEDPAVKSRLRDSFICWYCTDYDDAAEYLQDAGTPQTAIIDPLSPEAYLYFAGGFLEVDELLSLIAKATHENVGTIVVRAFGPTAAGGTARLVLGRTGGSEGRVAVKAKTQSSTGICGTDFAYVKDVLVWEDGDASDKVLEIPTYGSGTGKSLRVKLATLTSGAYADCITPKLAESKVYAEMTEPDPGTIVVTSPDPLSVRAGETLRMAFARRGGSDGRIAVKAKTQTSTALMGTNGSADFDYVKQTLEWGDGDATMRYLDIPTYVQPWEGVRMLRVKLATLATGAYAGNLTPRLAESKIYAEIESPVAFGTVSVASEAVRPKAGETLRLVFRRAGGNDYPIAVKYKVQTSTAVAGTDFEYKKGVVTWGDGESGEQIVEVPTYPSAAGKQLRVKLSTLTQGAYEGCVTPHLASAKVYVSLW